ncbi:hypothetical protein L6R49_09420 [Myxococcota bacterium]|nr:hypothetical protein [Myxococcota bacterium]
MSHALLLLLLNCAAKAPPDDATPLGLGITPPPPVSLELVAPVMPGEGRPWQGPPITAPQRAFDDAERLLARLLEGPASLEAGFDVAELIIAQLSVASGDPALRAPAACRAGDTYRLLAQAALTQRLPGTMGALEASETRVALRASAEEVAALSRGAYELVLTLSDADPRWIGHARWGTKELDHLMNPSSGASP